MYPTRLSRPTFNRSGNGSQSSLASLTLVGALALGLASPAFGLDTLWVNTGTGSWSNAANWNAGLPGGGDNAIVNNGGTALVTVDETLFARDLMAGIDSGSGQVVQDGGSLTFNAWTMVGRNGGSGTYNMSGGSLRNNGYFLVGTIAGATGTFNMSGGTLTQADGQVAILGEGVGSSGVMDISGTAEASFGSSELWLGQAGATGTLNMNGGSLTVSNWLAVGRESSSHGHLNLNAGTLNKIGGGDLLVGSDGNGTLTQTGGTLNANNWTSVGYGANGVGTYNMSGGTLNQTGLLFAGRADGTGTISVSGGQMNVSDLLVLGFQAGSVGTMTISGTAVVEAASEIWVGQDTGATGTLNLNSGASLAAHNWVTLGRNGSTGTVNMTGGTFTKTGGGAISIGSGGGAAGTGTFNQSGGILNSTTSPVFVAEIDGAVGTYNLSGTALANLGTLNLASQTNATGTVNLNGGVLAVKEIVSTGNATLNLNGGTLRANTAANGAGFLPASPTLTVNVRNGGAIIDSNGQDIVISQVLQHSALGGDNATDGGLVKNGAGTLTLGGANTYNGGSTVNGGTLRAGNAASFGSGNVTVNASGTLDLNGLNVPNVIVNNGGSITNASGSMSLTQNGGFLSGRIGGGTLSGTIGGVFSVTGMVFGTPTLTGTLGGDGAQFMGLITFAGSSIHAPGSSPGLQEFAAGIIYETGSTLEMELAGNTLAVRGTDFDAINVTGGDLTIEVGVTLALIDFGGAFNYASAEWNSVRTFALISSTGGGATSGSFALNTSSAGNFAPEGVWSLLTTQGINGSTVLTWTPVPEPSTYALLAGLAALGVVMRRRRDRVTPRG